MNKFELIAGRWYWTPGGPRKLVSVDTMEVECQAGHRSVTEPGSLRYLSDWMVDRQEMIARLRDGWLSGDEAQFWRIRRENLLASCFREPSA